MKTLKDIFDSAPSNSPVWHSPEAIFYLGAAAMAEVFAQGGMGALATELKAIRELLEKQRPVSAFEQIFGARE